MTPTLVARCHPALEPILPKPVPAAKALPDWLREMPGEAPSPSLGGENVRTLKHCAPMIDALSLGLLMPLACDLTVAEGEIGWDWEPPVLPDDLIVRAPVGVHVPEQAEGAPLALGGGFVVKFVSFWTLAAPEGWQVLFTHPFGHPDLPFRTLTGLVDADGFADGFVHFPAVWTDPGWEGVLPAGTPVAQAIAIPRAGPALETRAMTEAEAARTRAVQAALGAERGVYRKRFRIGRGARQAGG